jgi:mono/diheme cytochrome c family protein
VKPRNLTTGVFRGGRRPIDIYRRIHTGIKGTPMPGAGKSLTDEQIWDVVNYVLSIPFKESSNAH